MYEVRLKNANVFYVSYSGTLSGGGFGNHTMSYTGDWVDKIRLSGFSRDSSTYAFYNKYLKNDYMFNLLNYYFPGYEFTFLKLNQDRTPYKKPDFISYMKHSNSPATQPSVTGVLDDKGYQYIYSSGVTFNIPSLTGSVPSYFQGWLFPFEKILMTMQPDLDSVTGSIGQTYRQTMVSYMMTQQRYYVKVRDHQANRSNNSITRVSDNVQQFIQGKPTFATTVGLYDDDNNMLAVGKFSRPVQKLNFAPMSFKLRFFN